MVSVHVRETYDLATVANKMTIISIHTPKPDIIKRNFPGLLMQCKCYRPKSADVRVACASMLPLDVRGVGTAEGDVAPEDVFNPILYKAMSNKGMSQLEARINALSMGASSAQVDVEGSSSRIDVDTVTSSSDEFDIYYGLLSNSYGWKHANPQAGLSMKGLKPLVYEMVYNVGDEYASEPASSAMAFAYPTADDSRSTQNIYRILGKAKEFPFIPCTSYTYTAGEKGTGWQYPGFVADAYQPANCAVDVPYLHVVCGAIIIPPSRLHQLFYRMVIDWEIEFSMIRPLSEITNFSDLSLLGQKTHYQNYDYSATKEAVTGSSDTILDNDSCMVSANVEVKKVM